MSEDLVCASFVPAEILTRAETDRTSLRQAQALGCEKPVRDKSTQSRGDRRNPCSIHAQECANDFRNSG
jgi:hypothetical protein